MRRIAWLPLFATTGCYQALSVGYDHRFADHGGHGFEASWTLAGGEVIGDDEPIGFGRASVAAGSWGVRMGDAFGVMVQEDLGGDASFFIRPALAFLVIGGESRSKEDLVPWVGIGGELDAGFLVPLGDANALEIGVRGGADLGYVGLGTGGFVSAFIAFGWTTDGPDLYTR